ncbi:MAG: Crp/Fnr family transcriptional regulator [Gemmatimonadaceae bacterium]|nr:Crp/Fnr family transcriptional regulator [Chitinophagaceae bacterium]
MDTLVAFLQSSNLVNYEKATMIASHFTLKEMDKGDLHLTAGKISDEYFFLEKGFMRAFAHDTEGNEVTTNFYGDKQVVFEVSSFFNRIASRENFQCLGDCRGWALSYADLNMLFHTLPEFRDFGRAMLVKGFSSLKTRMLSMITETAEQRYHGLLEQRPEIFHHAPLKNIASYLGVTDTSLSRIRKEFSKK